MSRAVVVTGSLPPEGRDLDLIVRGADLDDVITALAREGCLCRDPSIPPRRVWVQQWSRFCDTTPEIVDLDPVERWRLPPGELEALFSDASVIEGFTHLKRPAPHHQMLLLARAAAGVNVTTPKVQRKIRGVLERDPFVWERAAERAETWGAGTALAMLRRYSSTGARAPATKRLRARAEILRKHDVRSLSLLARRYVLAYRPRLPRVVSFSGLDGAGKSSRVRILTETFQRLGVEYEVQWVPLGHNASIRFVRRNVKALFGRFSDVSAATRNAGGQSLVAGPNPILLAHQNYIVTYMWATLVALASALRYRGVVVRKLGAGTLVVFDRYALDTVAQSRYFYGLPSTFSVLRRLVAFVCPRPVSAFLLDVPAEVALARKPEQYNLDQLKSQERLLVEEAMQLGVHRVDGTLSPEELDRTIVEIVWRALGCRQPPPAG